MGARATGASPRPLCQAAEEPGVKEPQRKRHRPDGEGERSLAPPASSNYREGGSCSSGSALSLPPAPPPLEKRGLEHETEMTDTTIEQQGEPQRRREHLKVPQAADNRSSSSSSSESSTDNDIGLVDVCTFPSETSEAESRCRLVTLDLTEWDFSKAGCRNKCRKLGRYGATCTGSVAPGFL